MSQKSQSTAFLLCYFLGMLGVHRFYVGKVLTGILMLVTIGGLGIWMLIDAVLIAAGQMKDKQGQPLRSGPPDPDDPKAGFWVRAAAFLLDGLIVNVGVSALLAGASFVLPLVAMDTLATLAAGDPETVGMMISGVAALIALAVVPLYFAVLTASSHQATWGKRCFDLYVCTADGGQVGFLRALWRSVCYYLSSLILFIGYMMAGFSKDKRALHDRLAGTRVMYVSQVDVAAPPASPQVVDNDATTKPNLAGTGAAAMPALEADEQPSSRTGLVMMVAGALLLAGAAAAALL